VNHRSGLLVAVVALAVTGAVATAIVVTGVATQPVLVVTDDDGTELHSHPVSDGDEVAIEYTHSVERTLVTDVYVVSDGGLVTDRMLFSSYGAGFPSEAAVTREGDRYVYHPPEQRYETLAVSTGVIAGHELIVGDSRYDLADSSDGGTVHVHIENRIGI